MWGNRTVKIWIWVVGRVGDQFGVGDFFRKLELGLDLGYVFGDRWV